MNDDLATFVENVIEEYKDGRVNSYLMVNYLNQIKEKVMVNYLNMINEKVQEAGL